jgi:hypothetical protein
VSDSYDAPGDLLESIERSPKYLGIYTKIPPTPTMDDIIAKIMAELLSTLALATKEPKLGRSSKPVLRVLDVLYLTQ